MKEIHYWNNFTQQAAKYGITYKMYTDKVQLYNNKGVTLGAFRSAEELYFYMLGYESGAMDANKGKLHDEFSC